MNDELIPKEEPAGLFAGIESRGDSGVLGNIVSVVPKPDPAVLDMQNLDKGGSPETVDSASSSVDVEAKVLEVSPERYAYVQDHKGNPFDPEKHQVDANGHPVFNARGRVKVLEKGERNPVKLIFNNLKSLVTPLEPERPQEECVAQALSVSVEAERKEAAEIVVDMYGGAGYILRGAPFRKGWEKKRREKLVNALVRYQRIKNMTIPVKAEWILVHAFATDLLSVEGEAMFERKGGILGFIGRKGWNQRAQALADRVAAEPETASEAA